MSSEEEPDWLRREFVEYIHGQAVDIHDSPPGLKDSAALDSALYRPINLFSYGDPDLFDIAACYSGGIVQNHPFVDANKRTAFLATAAFLEQEGFKMDHLPAEGVLEAMLGLASGDWSEEDFAAWLRVRC